MIPPRNDIVTTSSTTASSCAACGQPFDRTRRQRYCTPACRQAAWRARQSFTTAPSTVAAPTVHRKQTTVYSCPECEQRYLGQQWCPDCNRPCTRAGLGGLCPSCEEPVTVDDLLPTPHAQPVSASKIR